MLTDSEHNCHQTLNFMNMSGPAPPPALFFSPPPASAVSSDAVTVWPIKSDHPRSVSRPELPPFKKPRSFEDTPSNSDVIQISTTRTLPPNPPVIRGMGRIFFKTRLCANFNLGICPYGISCNFAHGIEDLRKPPPNWHDMERVGNWEGNQGIVNRMRLCKRFSNGEECPYGERCNFLHEVPVKLREDPGRLRENSAINVGTTGSFSDKGRGSDQGDNNNSASSSVDSSWATQRPFFWKTRVCNKWEATGHCPYGEKCYYAHGIAELKKLGGPNEIEIANAGTATSRLFPNSGHDDASSSDTAEQMLRKKCLLKWKGPDKISRIYADWIDDLPFVRTLSSKVEN